MTREDGQPDQRGGGVPGNPDTFSNITISKFSGMNTVSPRGSFGQPNLLENIVLDRMGGYAACPSPRVVVSLGADVIGATPLDGVNKVFAKTPTAAYLVDLTSGAVTHTYATASQNIAPYERACVMTWDTANAQSGIVAHTISSSGAVVATDIIGKPVFTFDVVESDQFVSGGGGVTVIATPISNIVSSPVFQDSFERPDGSLGSDWSASDLVISGGKVKLGTPPTLGPRALANVAASTKQWQQVSATLTEGGGLIFGWTATGSYIVELTEGRGVQVLVNGDVYANLGVAPGSDPVRVEATYNLRDSKVVITTNNGNGLGPLSMPAVPTEKVGITARGSGTIDSFSYLHADLPTQITAGGTNQVIIGGTTQPTTPASDSRSYPAGSRYGFDPKLTHYIMLYPQPYSYVQKPKLGTTLNPRQSAPDAIRPYILQIPPFPKGIKREYKLVFDNPSNLDFQIYGASLPYSRPHTEYDGTPVGKETLRSESGVKVEKGTLTVAIPSSNTAVRTGTAGYADIQMLYQALNTGVTGKQEPVWTDVKGSTVRDGEVLWLNRGIYIRTSRHFTFSEYISRVASPPVDYLPPEVEWTPISNDLGEWAQLHAEGTPGGQVEVYRSVAREQAPFYPHSFFPVGSITELHLARTWVVADAVWRTFAQGGVAREITDIESPEWESATRRRTVYYSEPDTPWLFLERFIHLPLDKSRSIVAMRSVGDYLVFLGDADGVILAGDSEANFYARPVDIPGGFSQETTVAHEGVLYYRGVGGIYRMSGGRAEKISAPIETLVPSFPQSGVRESMSVDAENARVLVRVSNEHILCYDILNDGWTVLAIPGNLHQIGVTAYLSEGGIIKALDGAPNLPGRVVYRDIDGGGAYLRKSLKSVALTVESDAANASIALSTQAHRPDAPASGYALHKTHLVNQTTKFVQWRTPNRFGYAFDVMLTFSPNGSAFVIKPGVVLEVYKEGVIRKGY